MFPIIILLAILMHTATAQVYNGTTFAVDSACDWSIADSQTGFTVSQCLDYVYSTYGFDKYVTYTASGDCNLHGFCPSTISSPGSTVYYLTTLSPTAAPSTSPTNIPTPSPTLNPSASPTAAPTVNCDNCQHGGKCNSQNTECVCVYPYYGSNCQFIRDCSGC